MPILGKSHIGGGVILAEAMQMVIKKLWILAVLLLLALPSLAENPAGWWNSSTGSTILIWSNKERLVVTVKTSKGRHFEYPGKWIEFGYKFSYLAQGSTFVANFNHVNEIRVVNQSNDILTVWERKNKIEKPFPTPTPPKLRFPEPAPIPE